MVRLKVQAIHVGCHITQEVWPKVLTEKALEIGDQCDISLAMVFIAYEVSVERLQCHDGLVPLRHSEFVQLFMRLRLALNWVQLRAFLDALLAVASLDH